MSSRLRTPPTFAPEAPGPKLLVPTSERWVGAVLADFDTFLVDHAACERKAMSTGMLFIVRYPDRAEILEPLIEFAQEELDHFRTVFQLIAKRGGRLGPDVADAYAEQLLAAVRTGREARFLDRLLVSSLFEARGCERFGVLANALAEGPERDLYRDLTRADARHQRLFLDLAAMYFTEGEIQERLVRLLEIEGEIVSSLPVKPALYAGA